MKNKGFTMIEILAVFSITALVLLIVIPGIISTLKKSSEKSSKNFEENIFIATEAYIQEDNIIVTDAITTITLEELVSSGYLKSTIINPKNNEKVISDKNKKILIRVTKDEDGVLTYKLDDSDLRAYIITNIVKNGSFETGDTDWNVSNAYATADEKYSGKKSLKINMNSSMTYQNLLSGPIYGHKYYGALMFKSSENIKTTDDRFELVTMNAEEEGKSKLVFAHKNDKTTKWIRKSGIKELTYSTYSNTNNWIIRNFMVNASNVSYVDDIILVDLTETFGIGNEPNQEWCDQNIGWFEGTKNIYK